MTPLEPMVRYGQIMSNFHMMFVKFSFNKLLDIGSRSNVHNIWVRIIQLFMIHDIEQEVHALALAMEDFFSSPGSES